MGTFLKRLFSAPVPTVEDLPKPSLILARMIAQEIVENPDKLGRCETLPQEARMAPPSFTPNFQQQIFETAKCRVRFLVDDYAEKEKIRDVLVKGFVVEMSAEEEKIILAARDILITSKMRQKQLARERERADAEAAKQQKICDAIAAFQGISTETEEGVSKT